MSLRKKIVKSALILSLILLTYCAINFYIKYNIHQNIEALKSENPECRDKAAKDLIRTGKPAVAPLIRSFNGKYNGFAVSLGKIGDERAVGVLIDSLKAKADISQTTAFITEDMVKTEKEALARIGLPAASKMIEVIKEKRGGDDDTICILLSDSLSMMKDSDVTALLLENLKEDYNPYLLRAVESMNNPSAILSILEMTDSPEPNVRAQGELLLHNFGSFQTLKHLVRIKVTRDKKRAGNNPKCVHENSNMDYCLAKEIDQLMFANVAGNHFDIFHYYDGSLRELLCDGETDETKEVLKILSKENFPEFNFYPTTSFAFSQDELYSLVKDKDPAVRKAASISLNCDRDEYISNLTDNLRDENPEIRLLSAQLLFNKAGREYLEILLSNNLRNEIDKEGRYEEIADYRINPAKIAKLTTELNRENSAGRKETVKTLGFIGGEKSVRALTGALKDGDPELVVAAAESLAYMNDRRAVVPLCEILRIKDKKAKSEVICALGMLQDKRAVEPLTEILKDSDEEIKVLAIRSLGLIGDRRAVMALCGCLSNESGEVRALAAETLGNLGDKRAVPYLMKAADSCNEEAEVQVIRSLGKLKDRRAAPVVNTALLSKSYPVRKESIKAVKWAGNRESVRVLGKLLMASGFYDIETSMILQTLLKVKDPGVKEVLSKARGHRDELMKEKVSIPLRDFKGE